MNRIIRCGFRQLEIGSIVQHYKGDLYKVIGECKHTETEEELVIYHKLNIKKDQGKDQDQEKQQIWVRPKEMFFGMLQHEGVYKCRFVPYQK